jgi:Uma2 family endonuclease
MTAIAIHLHPIIDLTDEQFAQLCQANPDIKLERTEAGELIVMPPTGGETGDRNSEINFQLRAWNKQSKLLESHLTPLQASNSPIRRIALLMLLG